MGKPIDREKILSISFIKRYSSPFEALDHAKGKDKAKAWKDMWDQYKDRASETRKQYPNLMKSQ